MENKPLTLYELLGQVKSALKNTLPFSWWVIAEISELKVNYSGHCYLELIEKEQHADSIKAKVRATIWSSVLRMLQPYFETTTHARLSAGIKVMVKVSAEFHELYGFSLNITDIEPAYTLGELSRQKQEIINKLKTDGVFDMNRSLKLTNLPGKIAIISSKTAAGYGDFMDQLVHNQFGYVFYPKLFPAVMQGEEAEQSIIDALDRVYRYEEFFDAVVIIRGGGAKSDLHCFNNYWLNSHICQFPLPVLTGIGHDQDETIADLVAHTRLKTPTAVAEFLIACYQQADEELNEQSVDLVELASSIVREEKDRLHKLLLNIKPSIKERLTKNAGNLKLLAHNLKSHVTQRQVKAISTLNYTYQHLKTLTNVLLVNKQQQLGMMEKKCTYLDPFLILKRGYSITYHKGKAIKDAAAVTSGETIETRLANGNITSITI